MATAFRKCRRCTPLDGTSGASSGGVARPQSTSVHRLPHRRNASAWDASPPTVVFVSVPVGDVRDASLPGAHRPRWNQASCAPHGVTASSASWPPFVPAPSKPRRRRLGRARLSCRGDASLSRPSPSSFGGPPVRAPCRPSRRRPTTSRAHNHRQNSQPNGRASFTLTWEPLIFHDCRAVTDR